MSFQQNRKPVYIAFADESGINAEARLASIAVVSTHHGGLFQKMSSEASKIFRDNGINEFKWNDCRDHKTTKAAIEIINWIISNNLNIRSCLRKDIK